MMVVVNNGECIGMSVRCFVNKIILQFFVHRNLHSYIFHEGGSYAKVWKL